MSCWETSTMSAIELFGRWPPIAETIIDHLPYCIVKTMTVEVATFYGRRNAESLLM